MGERLQRQKSEKCVAGNARRKALFGVVSETRGLQGLDGGVRSHIRTGLRLENGVLRELTGQIREFRPFLRAAG
jgi:hypothetical protein